MKTNMKHRILTQVFAAAVLILAPSCDDALEEVVYSNLTDDVAFSTGDNAQAAVNSMYAPLHSMYREPMFYINDITTDCGYKSGSPYESLNDEAIFNDPRIQTAWDGFYQITSRANLVIDKVPGMADGLFSEDQSKVQMLGEAYFMRAFAYMGLTDVFWQVPLVTSSSVDATAKLPFSSIDEIEAQIEVDLEEAKSRLPKSYASKGDAGRPTYGAACGYLARLYMRQAGRLRLAGGDAASKWNAALTEVNIVLGQEGSEYSLKSKVWDVFDPSNEESLYNNELIFAIRASGTITNGSWDLGLQFTDWAYDMGWGNMFQPLEMTWQFDPADERYSVLQVTGYPDVYTPDKTYYRAPASVKETGLVNANHTVGDKTYMEMNELSMTFTQKYKFLNTWKYIYDTPNNLPLLRLSDMILCKAEILNELNGPSQEALDLVNRIRTRAFGNESHNLKLADCPDRDAFRSALCDERMFELNMECCRRTDLIRMGLWKDRMAKYINTIKERYAQKAKNEGQKEGYYDGSWAAYPDVASLTENDVRRYMPIPYREVMLNGSLKDARNF